MWGRSLCNGCFSKSPHADIEHLNILANGPLAGSVQGCPVAQGSLVIAIEVEFEDHQIRRNSLLSCSSCHSRFEEAVAEYCLPTKRRLLLHLWQQSCTLSRSCCSQFKHVFDAAGAEDRFLAHQLLSGTSSSLAPTRRRRTLAKAKAAAEAYGKRQWFLCFGCCLHVFAGDLGTRLSNFLSLQSAGCQFAWQRHQIIERDVQVSFNILELSERLKSGGSHICNHTQSRDRRHGVSPPNLSDETSAHLEGTHHLLNLSELGMIGTSRAATSLSSKCVRLSQRPNVQSVLLACMRHKER